MWACFCALCKGYPGVTQCPLILFQFGHCIVMLCQGSPVSSLYNQFLPYIHCLINKCWSPNSSDGLETIGWNFYQPGGRREKERERQRGMKEWRDRRREGGGQKEKHWERQRHRKRETEEWRSCELEPWGRGLETDWTQGRRKKSSSEKWRV